MVDAMMIQPDEHMYFLSPQGTIVNSSVFAMQSDSRYWDHPEKFMPERWLDEAGKLVSKKEGFLPFGVGK